jgi:hypothetical protein
VIGNNRYGKTRGFPSNLAPRFALVHDRRCAMQKHESGQGILLDEKSSASQKIKERA